MSAKQERAIRKVEKAIDLLCELQDMGLGRDLITRILEMLNALQSELER